MHPVRRAINLACALSLTLAGVVLTIFLLFFAARLLVWMIVGSVSMAFGGLCWLWQTSSMPLPTRT